MIIDDTLYRCGINTILWRFLTLKEVEKVLNECHSGACGGNLSGYATMQKILRVCYFRPIIFHDCILAIQKSHACQIYDQNFFASLAPLQCVIVVGPFTKWGIDFMTCNHHSFEGHGSIIVVVNCFTKWAESMPTSIKLMKQLYTFSSTT